MLGSCSQSKACHVTLISSCAARRKERTFLAFNASLAFQIVEDRKNIFIWCHIINSTFSVIVCVCVAEFPPTLSRLRQKFSSISNSNFVAVTWTLKGCCYLWSLSVPSHEGETRTSNGFNVFVADNFTKTDDKRSSLSPVPLISSIFDVYETFLGSEKNIFVFLRINKWKNIGNRSTSGLIYSSHDL